MIAELQQPEGTILRAPCQSGDKGRIRALCHPNLRGARLPWTGHAPRDLVQQQVHGAGGGVPVLGEHALGRRVVRGDEGTCL